jgi:LysM repeat protein
MTNSFRPQASPVDTFVSPSTVAPTTGFDQLVNALQVVNPSLNKYFDYRIKEEIADEKADITMQVAQQGFKGVIKKHRAKYGDDAANQLIGGSIFTQNQFEKLQAQDLGQSLTPALANLYQNKTFDFTLADGTVTQKPIHHFSGNSPQYQEYLQDAAALTAEKTQGISNKYLAQYFFPYQQKAIQEITASHIKQHNEYKVERHKNKLSGRLFSSWTQYEQGNKDLALEGIQEYIEETVNLGLADAVSAKTIINVAKNQASRIFEIHQQADPQGQSGYNAAMKYLEMVGQLKHGPKEKQKDGTFKQRVIAEAFGEDMLKFKVELGDRVDKLQNREIARITKEEEDEIINAITENPNSFSIAADLKKKFPHRREFLYEVIEEQADSRDELFNSFNYKVGIGYYGNDRVRMLSDLDDIKKMIGPTFTEEDEKRYKESAGIARSFIPKNLGNFNNRIKDMHREIRVLLGASGEGNYQWQKDQEKEQKAYLDLKTYINNRIMDEIDLVPTLTPREREQRYREIRAEYRQEAEAIIGDNYKFKDSLLTNEQKQEKQIREETIQGIIEDYGFSEKTATEIYDEGIETTIGGEEGVVEETVEEENKDKTWGEMMRDALPFFKKEDKDELVSQLNNVKENLGENESATGVIDSVLNALMGSVTAGNLEDKITSYKVKAGDTLSGLADQFKTSVKEIMDANNITDADFINIGQELMMPINTIVNTIGDAVVPESDLKNPSVLDEINITEPFKYDHLYRLAQEVGFTPEQARIMAAIALAESGGDAQIDTVASGLDPKMEKEFSLGLWQLNVIKDYQAERFPLFNIKKAQELYNPLTNARAAKIMFDRQGYEAWGAYTDGSYKTFLPKTN